MQALERRTKASPDLAWSRRRSRRPWHGGCYSASIDVPRERRRSRGSRAVPGINTELHYQGRSLQVSWNGYAITDSDAFLAYLQGPVQSRLADTEMREGLEEALLALPTTGMSPDELRTFLSSGTAAKPWEVGEALAECLLTDREGWQVHWPWNSRRDRRTPQASLPGADLVGFTGVNGHAQLLFGEVKTSNDHDSPPGVMNGRRSGLAYQLEELSTPLSPDHSALIQWLWSRCQGELEQLIFRAAMQRFINSKGKDLLLVGVLLRDTPPNERDLKSRAVNLGTKVSAPTEAHFVAWYTPHSIPDWPSLASGGEE